VLLFGGRGYLGRSFRAFYPGAVAADADVADRAAVGRALDSSRPDVVINCAGKTGRPNIDWCEAHPAETFRVNVAGALVVLEECLRRGVYLVHLSSGCIYQGDNGGQGFGESDFPNFTGSVYSRTKAISDQIIGRAPALTLRLRLPFDDTDEERNLLVKLRRYRRVLDVPNSLTYLPDFFRAAGRLIASRATGIYNVVNEGAMSPYEVMLRYRDVVDPAHAFERLSASGLPEVALAGRSNCRLSTEKLRRAGIDLLGVREAVDRALRSLASRQPSSFSLTGPRPAASRNG
jgi:3,5-epimerase/4-reductase